MSVSPQRRLPAPRVSTVIPTYNRARTVVEAKGQSYKQNNTLGEHNKNEGGDVS